MVIIVQLVGIEYCKSVGTTTDEFRYLYVAASASGFDWHSVMQHHPYYTRMNDEEVYRHSIARIGNNALIRKYLLIFLLETIGKITEKVIHRR